MTHVHFPGGGVVGGMKLPSLSMGSIAWTSSGIVCSPHQERQLEEQHVEARKQLEERANFLAEVQREQEKRLLEMKGEIAVMQAEEEKLPSRGSQEAQSVEREFVCCFGLLWAPYGHCFPGHCLSGWHCLLAGAIEIRA